MKFKLYKRHKLTVKRFISIISLLLIVLYFSKCIPNTTEESVGKKQVFRIVPAPNKLLYKRGFFNLEKSTRVMLNLSDDKSKIIGQYLINEIHNKTNYKLKIADRFTTNKISTGIEIIVNEDQNIIHEGFKIVISSNRIKLLANDSNGLTYGVNVIIGLLNNNNDHWNANQISIEDYPKSSIRGLYLAIQDSTLEVSNLKELLITNRINYLIIAGNWKKSTNTILNIGDTNLLSPNWNKKISKEKSIHNFYVSLKQNKEFQLFKIQDKALLHPDSIAILGEAMWSDSRKLNYEELKNHLESIHND